MKGPVKRSLIIVGAILLGFHPATPGAEGIASTEPAAAANEPVCVGENVSWKDAVGFVEDTLQVLEACGHDADDYRLELRRDDPFAWSGTEKKPEIIAVFLPRDTEQFYAVGVSPADPCVLSWIPDPSGLTSWQQEVLGRARQHVRTTRPGWIHPERWKVRVTEAREFVGVHLRPDDLGPNRRELRILLRKGSLSVVSSDETGVAPD
jgi:hypothetical protein